MFKPNEALWSFAYSIGQARFSFEVVAPMRELAEFAVLSAICQGAIAPSSACVSPRAGEGFSQP